MKIIVFGAGEIGHLFLQTSTDDMQVLAIADNNETLWGRSVCGHPIVNPAEITGMDYDMVVIAIEVDAKYGDFSTYQPIYSQLIDLGVPDNCIALQNVEKHLPSDPRMTFFYNLAADIRDFNIEGAVVECGVYRGWSAHYINKYFFDRRMFMFDTFNGFSKDDIRQESSPNANIWLNRDGADEVFKKGCRELSTRRCYYRTELVVCEGYVPDTFIGLENESFAFVNLDMDLFKPQYEALKFFAPRLCKGGVICLHDYYKKNIPGTKQAVDEFAKEYDFLRCPIGDGSSIALLF
jgi:hypothetical protein